MEKYLQKLLFTTFKRTILFGRSTKGGIIVKGSLIGKWVKDKLEFVYQHINHNKELLTGKCVSFPELTADGKIRLQEKWQWTCRDQSEGSSTLIEV